MYSRMRVTGLVRVRPCQSAFHVGGPVPTPSTNRPPVTSARDMALISVCQGGRASWAIDVPRRARRTTLAIAVRGTKASRQTSTDQTLSAPAASAIAA